MCHCLFEITVNLYHGHGVYTYPEDSIFKSYDGEFKDDNQSGFGILLWKNGDKYIGEWKDGYQEEEGKLYSETKGLISQGRWEKGVFVGK